MSEPCDVIRVIIMTPTCITNTNTHEWKTEKKGLADEQFIDTSSVIIIKMLQKNTQYKHTLAFNVLV